MFRQARVLSICAGFALACATAVTAQTAGDAVGAIDGTIRDASGAALPQVVVRIVGPAQMGARETLSLNDGFYRIQALAPGDYELTFTHTGFAQAIRRDVRVRSGGTTTVPITLLASFNETVSVERGASAVDRRATSLAAVVDALELADLPGSRTVGAILAAAPALQLTAFDVGGSTAFAPRPFSAYGILGYNRPTMEGIDVSQHQRFGFPLDYGSVDQAWVGLGAYGPQWPSPGVHLQLLTKSGGDQYHGSVYAGYQNGRWQARNIDADQVAHGATVAAGFSPRDANRQDGYQDLNADLGGFFVKGGWWWYASLRDQRAGARVVAFPSAPIDSSATTASVKTTVRTGSTGTLVFYAQPGINRQPIQLGAFLRPEAVNASEASTSNRETSGLVWKAEWSAAFRFNLLADVRVGQFVVNRMESPHGGLPRFEDLVTPAVDGGNRTWREDLRRTQLSASLSYSHDGRAGRHQLQAGSDSIRALAAETWYRGYPGDVLHVLRDGVPAEVYLFQTPSRSLAGQWWHSAFVSDSWYVHDRLTISGGLRYDRFRIFLPEQEHPAGRFNTTPQTYAPVDRVVVWNAVAPRVGASWDPVGDGRTFIKFNYGVYRLPPGTDVGFNANPNAPAWWERHQWTDTNADLLWQPGEESASPIERRGGTVLESLDPTLKLAFVREATAHVEQDFGSFSLSTGMIWRAERQQGLRQLSNRSFEMFTVATILRDPGPAGTTLDAAADGPEIRLFDVAASFAPAEPVVRNVPRSNSDYATWEIVTTRRLSGRWALSASFAHTWNRDQAGAYLGQTVRANEYAATPNDLINTDEDGRHLFRTWTAKAQGTWLMPWGLRVTPLVRHQSGQPFGRTVLARLNSGTIKVLAEPIGTRRQDNVTLVDLAVHKDFVHRGDRRLAAFVEGYNLLNANPAQGVSWASGATFLRPLSIVPPRIARVGMRVEW